MRPASSKLKLTTALLSLMVCPILARAQGIQADLVFGLLKGKHQRPLGSSQRQRSCQTRRLGEDYSGLAVFDLR